MRRTLDIALKDLLIWLRDPSALGILLGMPAILIVILGSALGGLSGGNARIAVAVVNLDSRVVLIPHANDQAADLEKALTGSKRIRDMFEIQRSRDLEVTTARVASGELAAALVIPKGFNSDLGSGRPTKLVVLADPGSGTAAGIWESVVKAVATRYSVASVVVRTTLEAAQNTNSPLLSQPGGVGRLTGIAVERATRDDALDLVKVEDTVASGALKLSMLDYYSLSMTAMFLMFGSMYGAFSTIRERRERTMARMLSSPTPRSAIVSGKMLGIFALGMGQFAALYVFTKFVLHVQWGASIEATLLVAMAAVAAVTGLATLISSVAHTERAAGGIGPLVVQVQALIGGAFFPVAILPEWLQWVRYLSVVGWTMEGWRRVQVMGVGVPGVVGPVLALLAFAMVFFAFGVWRTGAES
jgi:ABC-2 type transport system permease protein